MTDDDKALVETVRLEAEINKNYDGIAYKLLTRIADRIETLSAENERLREALMLCAKHVDWMPHPHCVEVETAIRAALGDTK